MTALFILALLILIIAVPTVIMERNHPMPTLFSADNVPGIGSIIVHHDGRIVLDGDIDLTPDELSSMVRTLTTASITAREHEPLRRPTRLTEEFSVIGDFHA